VLYGDPWHTGLVFWTLEYPRPRRPGRRARRRLDAARRGPPARDGAALPATRGRFTHGPAPLCSPPPTGSATASTAGASS
jgi:hypothetical protein